MHVAHCWFGRCETTDLPEHDKMRFLHFAVFICAIASVTAKEPAFSFDGQKYFLKYSPKDSEVALREFLPAGQTLDRWETLVSERMLFGFKDAKVYAQALVDGALESSPEAMGQIFRSDKDGSYVADFVLFAPEGTTDYLVEWNLMSVRKTAAGLSVTQYARRYKEFDQSSVKKFNADKARIIPRLADLRIP